MRPSTRYRLVLLTFHVREFLWARLGERKKYSGTVSLFECSCEAQWRINFSRPCIVDGQACLNKVYLTTLIPTSLTFCDSKMAAINANHIIKRSSSILLSNSSVFHLFCFCCCYFYVKFLCRHFITHNILPSLQNKLLMVSGRRAMIWLWRGRKRNSGWRTRKRSSITYQLMEVTKLWSVFFCGEINGAVTQNLNRVRLTDGGTTLTTFKSRATMNICKMWLKWKFTEKKLNNTESKQKLQHHLTVLSMT